MSKPTGQHIVPCLSLRHFVDARGQTWTYDKEAQKRWSAIPKETGTSRHFYSFESEDGSWDTSIETLLSNAEGAATPAYNGLVAGVMPRGKDRQAFAEFLALMVVRTPSMRRIVLSGLARKYEENMARIAGDPSKLEQFCRYLGNDATYEGPTTADHVRDQLTKIEDFDLILPKSMALKVFLFADEPLAAYSKMTWVLIQPKAHYFITSDCPVIARSNAGNIFDRSAQVTFPISPGLLLLLEWRRQPDHHGAMDKEFVKLENQTRARQAERFLYAHIEDKRIDRLSQQFKDTKAGSDNLPDPGKLRFGGIVVPKKWNDRKDRNKERGTLRD